MTTKIFTLPEVREMSVVAAAAVVAVPRLLQPQHNLGQRRQLVAEKYLIAAQKIFGARCLHT